MKNILSILFCTIASLSLHAGCPTGDITLTSQADINAFPSKYPGCTNMPYRITIQESVAGDIINLNGLSQLTSIGGDFFVLNNSGLTNLTGLSGLSTIAGSLSIEGNNGLTSLTGLTAIASVGSLDIQGNTSLKDLTGLGTLTSIPAFFAIRNTALTSFKGLGPITSLGCVIIGSNAALTNLTGLGTVKYIHCYVAIGENPVLTSLTGFNAVTIFNDDLIIANNAVLPNLTGLGATTMIRGNLQINGNAKMTSLSGLGPVVSIGSAWGRGIFIQNNPTLTNLKGLGTVTSVGGFIYIGFNAALTNITDLSAVTSIGTYLKFENNATLTSLSGLNNINTATITDLTIINSPLLSLCEVPSICAYLANPSNPATISGNATNCANRAAVQAACTMPPTCGVGGITFSTQADVNNFTVNYPGCTQIMGDVIISGNDITNLNGLSVVISIAGSLTINNNPILTSITGLSALTSIGGFFTLDFNPALPSLSSLSTLKSIGGNLVIRGCTILPNLLGLSGLTTLGGNFVIISNNALTSLTGISSLTKLPALFILGNPVLPNLNGLSGITTITGFIALEQNPALASVAGLSGVHGALSSYLSIRDNKVLTNLTGLEGITSVGAFLGVGYNDVLTNVSGLSGIISVGGYLDIENNAALTSLTGFSGITSIGGYLRVANCGTLSSLVGLGNINPTTITNLTLQGNPFLSYCEIPNICTYLSNPLNPATISGNATNCANRAAVESACIAAIAPTITSTTPSSICGPGAITLSATASSGVINWYNTPTGGLSLFTGPSFTTPIITPLTTSIVSSYYVDATNNGLTSARFKVDATWIPDMKVPNILCHDINIALNPPTSVTITTADVVNAVTDNCTAPNDIVLSLTQSTFTLADLANSPLLIGVTAKDLSGNLNSCNFRVNIQSNGAYITNTSSGSRCGTGTVTLGATATSGVLNWYNVPTGGSILGTGSTFITPIISITTPYYVDVTDAGYTSTPRTQVFAKVLPSLIMSTPSVINVACNGNATGKVIVSTTGGTGAITYSMLPNVGTQSPSGTFNGLTAQAYVFTATDANGCTQSSSIIVTEPPKIIVTQFTPKTSIQCVGSTITFSAVATGVNMTVKWQKNGNDVTTPVPYTSSTTASYTSPSLLASDNGVTYRAIFQDGCPSDEIATAVGTLTINTPSVGGTLSPAQSQGCGPTTVNLLVSGINGSVTQWELQTNCNGAWASIGSAGLSSKTVTTPNSTTCYRVKVENGVCPAAYSTISTVIVDKPAVGGNVSLQGNQNETKVALCPSQNAILTLSNSVGHILKWQYSFGNSYSWVDLPNTENALALAVNGSSVSGTTYYRAVINTELSICTGTVSTAYSTAFKITKKTNCKSPDGNLTDSDIATDKGIKIMKAYPNPTSGFISLNIENVIARDEANGAVQIDILDLMGRVVQRTQQKLDEGYNILSLDMSNLSSGLYLVRIKDSDMHVAVARVSKI